MPKSKDFYHRIEILDECFRRRNKKWHIDELVECLNEKLQDRYGETVSKRTIQYGIDYLINEKCAPIEKVRDGQKVYYSYSDANYSIKNLPLSDEEIILLKDAVAILKQVGGVSMAKDIVAVVDKLENSIASNAATDRTIILFEKHTHASGLEHIDDLFTSIKEQITLKVQYQPFGKEPYEQLVHPYLLKEYRNRWFLIARDNKHNTICNLALDRIKGIKPAKIDFEENDLFDPNTYFNHLIGVTFPQDEEISDIIINVKAKQAPYIQTKPIHFTQETIERYNDGGIQIRLRLIANYELRSVLLGYGEDIEVLEPLALREQLKVVFTNAAQAYA